MKKPSRVIGSWALLILALAVLLYNVALCAFAARFPGDRCSGYMDSNGVAISEVAENSPLRPGDLVTHVNGHDVGRGLHVPGYWYRFLFTVPATGATYTVVRDGQSVQLVAAWQPFSPLQAVRRLASLSVIGLAFVGSAVLVLLSRTKERAVSLIALFFCLEGLNLINNAWMAIGVNLALSAAWLFEILDLLSFGLTISVAFHTMLIFPEHKWLLRRFPRSPYLIHLLNLLVALAGISGVVLLSGDTSLLNVRIATFRLFYPLAGLEILASIAHLTHTYLTSHRPGVRNQIRWLIWGVVLGPMPWLLLYTLPVALGGRPLVPFELTILSLILLPISFCFSVTRRGLMVVDTVIHRSLLYLALTALLVGVYLLVVGVLDWLVQATLGAGSSQTSAFLAIVLIALAANPLRLYLQRLIDRAFYRHHLDFRRLLHEVGGRLSTTLHMDALLSLLTDEIPRRLQVSRATLLIRPYSKDQEKDAPLQESVSANADGLHLAHDHPLVARLEQSDAPLVVGQFLSRSPDVSQRLGDTLKELAAQGWQVLLPLRSGGRLPGVYLLGAKLSGDLYGHEEIDMLSLLGHQIAATLENIRLYRQVERYSHDLETLVAERTRELAGERDRLNVILQNMADGLLVTGPAAQILLTNPAFEEMVRRPAQALDFPGLSDLVEHALETEGKVHIADLALNERVFKASASALQDRSGVVTVLRDITREVEVDRMKTDFISTVSHELRTPLTSVMGFAKLIRRTFERTILPVLPEDERTRKAARRVGDNLDIIVAEGERLTRLINDVLDIAKMEAGKVEWRDQPLDLPGLVRRAVEGMRELAAEKGLPVRVQVDESLPPLVADPDRIFQVLTNLLSNAIKFTEQGEVLVSVKSHAPGVIVSVADTGMGIPEEEMARLFQRFQQVGGDTLTNKPRGTGLGLAICHEIVAHYGGAIWAESTPGAGSTFYFTLPASLEADGGRGEIPTPLERVPSLISEIRRRISGALPLPAGHLAPVLIVDDEPHIRSLLAQELSDAGYRTLEAANGSEALALARRHQPSIILLDVMMPDLSGFDVTRVLKSDPATASIPILILSIVENRELGLALGADACLTKPVDSARLLDTISALLAGDAGRPTAMVAAHDRSVVEVVTAVLREQGFEVAEAYDPRGAILTAQEVKPDLVILGEYLSRLNDAEVLKALRFQHPSRDCTIIVLSGEKAASVEEVLGDDG